MNLQASSRDKSIELRGRWARGEREPIECAVVPVHGSGVGARHPVATTAERLTQLRVFLVVIDGLRRR